MGAHSHGGVGPAWELGAELDYYRLALGFRYASFPRYGGTATASSAKWDTTGLYAGWAF